jgi:DNA polymerase-4
VAPNKFLPKIASDWKKPERPVVIQPHEVQSFLLPLPVGRVPRVGQVTEGRMKAIGIATVGDLYSLEIGLSNFQTAEDPASPLFVEEPAEEL